MDGERRVCDALALTPDTIDTDRIAGVAFEHDVDIDVFGIDPGEGIEDAAFAGYERCPSFISCHHRYQLLCRNVIHVKLQGALLSS